MIKSTMMEDRFDEFLDDNYGPVLIFGLEYEASRVLKEIDPIAYRENLLFFEDIQNED